MDFDSLLSKYKAKACVVSIDFYENDTYGNIRILEGNKAHYDDMAAIGHPFVPDSPYEAYFPKNRNFEDYCFRCTRSGRPQHAYVELYTMDLWLNMFLIPIESDKPNTGYCIYVYDVSPKVDSDAMVDLSGDVASEVLKACVKLRSSNDIKKTFQEVIEDIRSLCGSEHCCILLTDPDSRTCEVLGDAFSKETKLLPMSTYMEGFYEITETWASTLGGSTCIIIKDQHDMDELHKQNPVWADSLKGAMAKTVVLFPLRFDNKVLGYMWAINFNAENTIKIKKTLELTTYFLASEIANHLLLKKLEVMSSIDSLTGIKNRNVMNIHVDQIVDGKKPMPEAVLFADLNGLKRENDEKGHSAGDKMLCTAAKILQKVFRDGDVYRAGGDEFMVMIPEIAENEVPKRIQQVHEVAKAKKIHFSIGACHGGKDIRKAMHTADERMYADKNAYYEAHPEEKYR